MDASDLPLLLDPEVAARIDQLVPLKPEQSLAVAESLRGSYSPELAAAVMTQATLRTRALDRFGPIGADLWWTSDGLEQASRPEVAARHAALLREAGATTVADLGCGVGIDTLAFAAVGLRVVAVERDPLTAAVARANVVARGVGDQVTVVEGDATTFDATAHGCDAVFMDPARRAGGRRLLDPEQWSPPLSAALRIASSVPAAVLKVAPGLDRSLLPSAATFEAVSVQGQLVEVTLRLGAARAAAPFAAVLLPDGPVMTGDGATAARVAPWGQWLLEPDDAVIRSGLINDLAAELGAALVDPQVAYLTCDGEPPADRRYARFEIDEVLPFSVKSLRAALRVREIGSVEIKKRAIAVDPEQLRRDLKLVKGGPNACTVLLTRIGDSPFAVIAQRR
jgi:SAM-dependent methyltransferase